MAVTPIGRSEESPVSPVDKRILLCEPNSTSGFLFSQALAEWEYVVDLAENTQAAIKHLEGAPYPVVVISLELPVFERADLLDALRTRFPITRIMLAGNPSSPEEEAILNKLPYDRLGKPYRPSSVVTSLSAVFESISEEEWDEAKRKAEYARATEEADRAERAAAAKAEEKARAEETAKAEEMARAAEEAATAESEARAEEGARAAREAATAEAPPRMAQAGPATPSMRATSSGSVSGPSVTAPSDALSGCHETLQSIRRWMMVSREAQLALETLNHRLESMSEQGNRAEQISQASSLLVEDMTRERDQLRSESRRLQDELASIRSELEDARSQGGAATSRLEAEKRQAETARQEAQAHLADVQGELTVAREQIETLRSELEEARSQASDGAKDALAHSRELEEMNETLREQVDALKGQVEGTAETAIAQVYSTLQILFSGLPFPSVAMSGAGSIIGVSPALCKLAGVDPKSLVGHNPAGQLPELINQALQRCGEAFQAQLNLTPPGTNSTVAYKALGGPIPVGKRQIRILILQTESSLADHDSLVLVEQFKETLFSIRIAAETLSKKAQAENVREMAAGMFQEADQLLTSVDKIFGTNG